MGTTFNFNSYGNSKQNNNIVINNDIDKILDELKELNISSEKIKELKVAIKNDETEVAKTNSIGKNVKNWCTSVFNEVTTNAIVNTTLPILQSKLQKILYTIYHFPIQF